MDNSVINTGLISTIIVVGIPMVFLAYRTFSRNRRKLELETQNQESKLNTLTTAIQSNYEKLLMQKSEEAITLQKQLAEIQIRYENRITQIETQGRIFKELYDKAVVEINNLKSQLEELRAKNSFLESQNNRQQTEINNLTHEKL